jgi:hypothetical protein
LEILDQNTKSRNLPATPLAGGGTSHATVFQKIDNPKPLKQAAILAALATETRPS